MGLKENVLIHRNENGEILPIKENLGNGLGEVSLIPLTRGEVLGLISKKGTNDEDDHDKKVFLSHLVDPKFTEEEYKFIKWNFINIVIDKIFKISGVELTPEKTEEELKKK